MHYTYNHKIILNSTNVETLFSFLKHLIYQAYIYLWSPNHHQSSSSPPKWFTSTLQHELNQLHMLRRRYSSNPSSNQAKAPEQRVFNLLLVVLNIVMKTTCKINLPETETVPFPIIMHYNSSTTSTGLDQACPFNEYFFSVFTRDSSPVSFTTLDSSNYSNILPYHQMVCI